MRTRSRTAAIVGMLGAALMMMAAVKQTTGPRMPPLVGESMYGPDLFNLYCATCHGRDAKGRGPVAQSLKTPPPDLTLLARRNGGLFPRGRVKAAIAGETHEYTDMYPGMAKSARDEGFTDIADWFETLAKAERSHANRFQKALDQLN